MITPGEEARARVFNSFGNTFPVLNWRGGEEEEVGVHLLNEIGRAIRLKTDWKSYEAISRRFPSRLAFCEGAHLVNAANV